MSRVLRSATKYSHDVVAVYYSVCTSAGALERGEAAIRHIGDRPRALGRLQQVARLNHILINHPEKVLHVIRV
jgi:hypothetical protein